METEDLESSNPSHTAKISFKRQLFEGAILTMVALYTGSSFTNFILGEAIPGERDENYIPRFVIMFLINGLFNFSYKKYRGV